MCPRASARAAGIANVVEAIIDTVGTEMFKLAE
jgi:hypothetical protein